jgi:hypothetical protein
MPVVPAPVKQNDIATRTEAVAYILNDNPRGHNRLVISPLCRTLIVGMAGRYHLVREEDGELRPKKDKYSNLCFAAGTMISTPHGARPIETLRDGDFVSTPFGPKCIIATGVSASDIVRLRLSNGVEIRCTPDHPFWTDRGWIVAANLDAERLMIEGEQGWKLPSKSGHASDTRSLSSWASDFIVCARAIIAPCRTAACCTASSGSITMGQYPSSTTFITATATGRIMPSKTSSALPSLCTAAGTCGRRNEWQRLEKTSEQRLSPPPKSAAPIQNGHPKSARPLGQQRQKNSDENQNRFSTAAIVASLTERMRLLVSAVFARCRVRAWRVRLPASMMWRENALHAAQNFKPINTAGPKPVRIIAREWLQPDCVYNITVNEAHCYFANGALVSNCDALQYLCLGLGEGRRMVGLRPIGTITPVQIRHGRKTMRRVFA